MKEAYTDNAFPGSGVGMSALNQHFLAQPLQAVFLRCYFLNKIFSLELDTSAVETIDNRYESYFNRYAGLCRLAANRNRGIESVSHWQMASIVCILHDRSLNKTSLVEPCVNQLRATLAQKEDDNNLFELATVLIDVAVDLWLMISVGRFPGNVSYDEPVIWKIESQHALLERVFSPRHQSEDLVKLQQVFTAAHLEQIGGIQVVWTSSLADHLLLKDDDTKLMLFHQVSILQLHLLSESSTLPKALVDETIRSLSLLVPPILGEPNSWFQQQKRRYPIDASAGICDRLNSSERQIDKFVYWRDRIVLLKRTFDDAEPRNISQLWFDDRKKTQWFTFWVAVLVFIMTVFFGVIQSVAGIVQAWAAVQSLNGQSSSNASSS